MKKFLSTYILFSILIGFLVTYQVIVSYKGTIKNATESTMSDVALIEQAIIANLESINNTLSDLSLEISEHPYFIKNYPVQKLKFKKKSLEYISTIELRITDKDGAIRSSSSSIDQKNPVNISDRFYFQNMKNDSKVEFLISEPIFGRIRHKWVFIAARSIRDINTKQFLGVVFASVQLDFLNTYKNKLNVDGTKLFSVAMGDPLRFAFRYPSNLQSQPGELFKAPEQLKTIVSAEEHANVSIHKSTVDGEKRILGASRIGGYPIIVMVGSNYNEVIKPWILQSTFLIIMALIIILVAFFTGKKLVEFSATILRQQEQLVDSAKFRALGEMAGSIAHEINNPMAIIAGNIRKVERLTAKNSTDFHDYANSLQTINRAVERVNKIIMGLKKISRNNNPDSSLVVIEKIVTEAVYYCNERLGYYHVNVEVKHQNPGVELMVDLVQISQVVVNLINNSIDAIEKFSERWIKIETQRVESFVQIRVTDSGHGISENLASKIMDPFFTTKGINQGSGLGLSISKRIVESYNGKFYYDSKMPRTSFVIEIPIFEIKKDDLYKV